MTFAEAAASGLPMRRREWQTRSDPLPDWRWLVLDDEGYWLLYDAEDRDTYGLAPFPPCKRLDYLATDWEVWP